MSRCAANVLGAKAQSAQCDKCYVPLSHSPVTSVAIRYAGSQLHLIRNCSGRGLVRNRSKARFANGVVAAFVAAFFLVHSLLGGLAGIAPLGDPATWIVWVGAGIVLVHVAASIATSYGQLTDAEFPPSARKKRHLVLKWVTGGALAIVAAVHIACMQASGAHAVQASAASAATALVLVAALAVHSWIGAKSLVVDLGLGKALIVPFRVVVCLLAVVAGCLVIAGMAK